MYSQEEILEIVGQEKLGRVMVHDTNLHTPNKVMIPQHDLDFSDGEGRIIIYSVDLARAFVQDSLDLRIGELKWRFHQKCKYGGPWLDSSGQVVYDSGCKYYLGQPVVEMYCSYRLAETDEWHEVEMERGKTFFWTRTPPPIVHHVPGIFYYFRLVGRVRAEYSPEALEEDRISESGNEFSIAERWYEPGSIHHHAVVYDNPYGPFSNYAL